VDPRVPRGLRQGMRAAKGLQMWGVAIVLGTVTVSVVWRVFDDRRRRPAGERGVVADVETE
jgi:hypothetical protein